MSSTFDHKQFLKQLTVQPGIYQMLNVQGDVLYVGKAKNLKNRVKSYFLKQYNSRIASLVSQIADIKIIVTKNENEALLLENNLIKKLKPRYNILFRDDKSYPYIYISSEHNYPSITYHRGARNRKGKYYGPYPSGSAVKHFLDLVQKLFKVRQCSDSFFRNRSRPCIQYQIKRCSAPCVKLISKEEYQESIKSTELFLQGKSNQLIKTYMQKMQVASDDLDFETAANYRDIINSLRHLQTQQTVVLGQGDIDIIATHIQHHNICVHIMFIRDGNLIGSHSYFSKLILDETIESILENFLTQFYLENKNQHKLPKTLLLEASISNKAWLEEALTQYKGSKVQINKPEKGEKLKWVDLAKKNAKEALFTYLNRYQTYQQRWEALKAALQNDSQFNRIECFDISHTMGESTVASCVVFTEDGPKKQSYRRYNIINITPGDDYAAMREALKKRYQSLLKKNLSLPDVLLIDGGKGQLKQAETILEELNITDIKIYSICKGEGRKAIYDKILLPRSYKEFSLDKYPGAMFLLQQLRDEAHRFAISGHVAKREKKRTQSILEEIPGVGAKRRKQILNYFGGLQALKEASTEQIAQVPGISLELAKKIADYLK